MPARDDYILRFLDLLRQALAESLHHRKAGKHEQAMLSLMFAQEKLFARPMAEFVSLSLDQQIHLLTVSESQAGARTKVIGYATLLREAGLVYAARDRLDLGVNAYQLALHVALTALSTGAPAEEKDVSMIRDLLSRIPPERLQAPVVEMLEKLNLPNPSSGVI